MTWLTTNGVEEFSGFKKNDLNNTRFQVRDIIDADHFTFTTNSGFSERIETGGGTSIRINSKLHGWEGVHDNFLLEFNGLEWSGTLEITEMIPQNDANGQTSTSLVAGATVSSGTNKGGGSK